MSREGFDVTTMVDVGDAELACPELGAGSPVLWLHGSGPGATGMSNLGANLSAFGDYRNVVVDRPGWGLSPRPATDESLIFSAAERVCRAMEALGIERAHLVGNSCGGGVAMRIAMAHPERVHRLVLMAPGRVLPAMPNGVDGVLEADVLDGGSLHEALRGAPPHLMGPHRSGVVGQAGVRAAGR